jgi:DNA-binding protein
MMATVRYVTSVWEIQNFRPTDFCSTVFTVLCIASEGNISQMPCIVNGRNRYSTAVFVAELVRKCFVLEVRKEKITTARFIKEKP